MKASSKSISESCFSSQSLKKGNDISLKKKTEIFPFFLKSTNQLY